MWNSGDTVRTAAGIRHIISNNREGADMIGAIVLFELKDEVKKDMANIENVRKHLSNVVQAYRSVPGLKQKYFIMNKDTLGQGAFLIWDTQEHFDRYLASDLWKTAVLDIAEGTPQIQTYVLSASLSDGVLL